MNAKLSTRPSCLQIGAIALIFQLAVLSSTPDGWAADGTSTSRATQPIRVVAFGDSLTAGYRLRPDQAFPAKLQRALVAKGHRVEVTNAGVSGDTTAAGLERLDWAIPAGTDVVIIELGANDALRGIKPATTRRNLEQIIRRVRAKGAKILLAGMVAPRNWGEAYARQFDAIFPELARRYGLAFYPFFLQGVALKPELNLDDGLHPNGRGVDVVVRSILPKVEQLVAEVKADKRQRAG